MQETLPQPLLAKINALVSKSRRSPKRSEILKQYCTEEEPYHQPKPVYFEFLTFAMNPYDLSFGISGNTSLTARPFATHILFPKNFKCHCIDEPPKYITGNSATVFFER
ncbi:hypothetical protein Pelo_5534 [Pelomyxa schiedti]|nr:hypothetical protein Pelo_5534 [Pelomyxa schiedti]